MSIHHVTAIAGHPQRNLDFYRLRFESGAEGAGTVVDLRRMPGFWSGADGIGTVHHVAFRAPSGPVRLPQAAHVTQPAVGKAS